VIEQMTDDPATEKPGSTENRDEPAMADCAVCMVFCHGGQPACLPARFEQSRPGGNAAPQQVAAFLLVNERPGRLDDLSNVALLELK
jgi:hypothetical protein